MNGIIWKESIYKNNFRCNCGTRLADKKGQPTDNVCMNGENEFDKRMFCMKCKNIVAVFKEVPTPDDYDEDNPLNGDFSKFQQKVFEKEKEVKENMREINRFKSKIAELESKVSFQEHAIKNLKEDRDKTRAYYSNIISEKEKEIKVLEHRIDELCEMNNDWR